jgi:hypothetical protein
MAGPHQPGLDLYWHTYHYLRKRTMAKRYVPRTVPQEVEQCTWALLGSIGALYAFMIEVTGTFSSTADPGNIDHARLYLAEVFSFLSLCLVVFYARRVYALSQVEKAQADRERTGTTNVPDLGYKHLPHAELSITTYMVGYFMGEALRRCPCVGEEGSVKKAQCALVGIYGTVLLGCVLYYGVSWLRAYASPPSAPTASKAATTSVDTKLDLKHD